MKKIISLLVFCLVSFFIIAQPHQAFNYQAVVRDISGNIISDQAVSTRIGIINGFESGPVVYQETHSATTNEFGLITLIIGEGTPVPGYDFENVDWSDQFKFIEVEIDPAGGTNYTSMGVSELLSVPYALYSKRSMDSYWENTSNNIYYTPGNVGIGTNNPLNKLEVNGTTLIGSTAKGIRFRTNGAITDIESLGSDLAINYQGWGNTVINVDGGNVGIGTLTPNYKLEVDGGSYTAIRATSTNDHAIYGSSSGLESAGVLGQGISSSSSGVYGYNWNGGFAVRGYSPGGWGGYFDGDMYVSGNTGIGTTTPDNRLVIKTTGAGDVLKILSNTNYTLAKFRHTSNNSCGLYLYDGSNNNTIFFYGDGNSFINSGSLGLGTANPSNAKLQIEGTDTYDAILRLNNTGPLGSSFFMGSTNSAWGGGINSNIFVMGHGAPASNNIDLIINSSGQVGIATTAPTQTLDVNGRGRFRLLTTGTVNNAVYQTADGTLITGSSDIRLKENIEPLEGSLEKVNQLQGVSFTWKADPQQGKSIGFIAQEFEKVVPELVFTNQTDGYKGINYAEVSALLAEAIKEQQKTIEKLKTRIEMLENGHTKN